MNMQYNISDVCLCVLMQTALKLGLSHAPLANAALDALEDWSSHVPLETMQPCYTSILPLLDGYLKTTSNDSKPHCDRFCRDTIQIGKKKSHPCVGDSR